MRFSSDVVVVGGGIVGCTTALSLARKGIKVTLVERGDIGGCASGFSAGLLNPLQGHGIPGPLETLALESFTMHAGLIRDIQTETGVDVHSRRVPSAWVALEETELPGLQELLGAAQRAGGRKAPCCVPFWRRVKCVFKATRGSALPTKSVSSTGTGGWRIGGPCVRNHTLFT